MARGCLSVAADDLQSRTRCWADRPGWPAHPASDLRRVKVEFRQGPAQRIAVHPELLGCLALVAPMPGQNLKDEALLELTDGVGVIEAGGMHLEDEIVEFAFHSWRSFTKLHTSVRRRAVVDPVGRSVLEVVDALEQLDLQVPGHHEGYLMRPSKQIGCEEGVLHPLRRW